MDNLKQKVFDGGATIFEVTDMKTGESSIEELNYVDILDITIGCNSERMSDLVTLYDGDRIVYNDKTYRVLVGYKLIAYIIDEVAQYMQESVEESEEREQDLWNEYLKESKGDVEE